MSKGKWRVAAAALAGVAVLAPAVTPAQGAKTTKKVVEVGDYFFSPEKMTVKKNTVVVWRWPEGGGDAHDVYLEKGPKGVKKFQSEVLIADVTYRQKLKKAGTYKIVCTLHPDTMRQTIKVK